jgi:prepilin-type N-terminal cleavage/methylation domain-containing protein
MTVRRARRTQLTNAHGFTLVELTTAMAIILTIAAIAVPNMLAAIDFARIARAVGDIHTLEDEITLYDVIS